MLKQLLDFTTSLKLTMICLSLALVLVFVGTLAQVELGIHAAQEKYFQSWIVWWQLKPGIQIPVLPGGHLLGGVLLLNLIASHIRRFQWKLRKAGIHLIHAGLVVMIAGGILTDLLSRESQIRLDEGESKNYSESPRLTELVFIDESNPGMDQVTAIPEARLRTGGDIRHPSLPFTVTIDHFFQNSRLQMLSQAPEGSVALATHGAGSQLVVTPLPRASAMNERDLVTTIISLHATPSGQKLGTYLVSNALLEPQSFSYAGKTWSLQQRQARYYQPYTITLHHFTHERYPGTEIPKNFASRIGLVDPEHSVNREVVIFMNNPLRYRGETFYQSGFDNNDTTSILQVVHNPSIALPYLSCLMVGLGLLMQFGYHLTGFMKRRRKLIPA